MAQLFERDQIQKREMLLDLMVFADMRATPIYSSIAKDRNVTNTLFEWTTDSYIEFNPDDCVAVDGTDATQIENHAQSRALMRNYIQYFRLPMYKVSPLAQNVSNVAGIRNEEGEAKRKAVKDMARLIEKWLLSDTEMAADDGSTGYKSRAIGRYIQSTAQSINPVPEAQRPTAAQIRTTAASSLNEDTDIRNILKAVFDATGMNGDFRFVCGSEMRHALTNSTRVRTGDTNNYYTLRTFAQEGKAVQHVTDFYTSDHGTLRVETSSFIGWSGSGGPGTGSADTDRAYFLDMSKLKLRTAKLPDMRYLEDRGSGKPLLCEAWLGLECTTPRGMGKIVPA